MTKLWEKKTVLESFNRNCYFLLYEKLKELFIIIVVIIVIVIVIIVAYLYSISELVNICIIIRLVVMKLGNIY